MLAVASIGLTTSTADAALFVHNFDMHGDYSEYLHLTTNAFVLNEGQPGNPTVYWSPTQANVWGEIIYKYELPFAVTQASVYGSILAISDNSRAFLDVSADGLNWTTIESGSLGPPLTPIDVSAILQSSQTAYVRSRLYSDYVGGFSYAQFLRTYEDSPNMVPNIYEFRAVPEPAFLTLCVLGLVVIVKRFRS